MKKRLWKFFLYVSCVEIALGCFFLFFGALGLILDGKNFWAKVIGIVSCVISCFAVGNLIGACCMGVEKDRFLEIWTFGGLAFGSALIGMNVLFLFAVFLW